MNKIFIDFETRSAVDIKTAGAWKYAMDPSTDIMCMAFSKSDGSVEVVPGKDLPRWNPDKLGAEVFNGQVIVAHNAAFEYAIWNYILAPRYGFPYLWSPEHWACTQARAAMCGLPISLENCGRALGVPIQKDLEGRRIMLKLAKPAKDALGLPYFIEDEDLHQRLRDYCKVDVLAEMELDKRLPELPPLERKIWELDLTINHRGVAADVQTSQKALALADSLTNTLNTRLRILTGGAVEKASRIQAIKTWLEKAHGIKVESINKQSLTALLSSPTAPQKVKDVLLIRRQVGKSSTAKFSAIVEATGADGRFRGALQYHGAATGRWSGRLVQLQNLPKGMSDLDVPAAIADIQTLEANSFAAKHLLPMETLASCIRGMIYAPEGKVLMAADYAAIEARVLLWLANDHWALAKFKMGADLYVDMAAGIYKKDLKDITKPERQLGKVAVLGCGYGMGHKKFKDTCESWGIDISEEMAQTVISAYREKYKIVVQTWYAVEKAAVNAVRNPTQRFECMDGKVLWGMDAKREFLVARLPSGRHLRYYRPEVKAITTSWGAEKDELHYWAESSTTHQWELCKTYGGSLVENLTQAVARDIMANGMLNAEAVGYPVILTVHDEMVAEVEKGKGTLEGFVKEMCRLPSWADGCPVTAEGWEGPRYKK